MNNNKNNVMIQPTIEFYTKENEHPYFLVEFSKLYTFQIDLINEDYLIKSHNEDNIIISGSMINQKDYIITSKPNALYFKRNDEHTIIHSTYKEEEKITIILPKSLFLRSFLFSIKSGEGKISNIDADQVIIKNVSGEMNLHDIESSNFTLETMTGDLTLKNLTSSNATFKTMTGDIELSNINITHALHCHSLEGDIDLETGFAQEFFFQTESGDFDGKEFYPNTISFESVSGDLDIKNKQTKHDIIIKSKQAIEGEITIK